MIKKEELERFLFSSHQQDIDPLEKFGQLLMLRIIETSVFTGQIYQNLSPRKCKKDDVIKVMNEAGRNVLFQNEEFLNVFTRCR